MKIKSENGMVTFIMRAGKDKVRSSMSLAEANRIVASGKNVVETEIDIIVDETYYFPVEKVVEENTTPKQKSYKKRKTTEVNKDE